MPCRAQGRVTLPPPLQAKVHCAERPTHVRARACHPASPRRRSRAAQRGPFHPETGREARQRDGRDPDQPTALTLEAALVAGLGLGHALAPNPPLRAYPPPPPPPNRAGAPTARPGLACACA
eukprot:scaffold101_cov373-Prasinococcus_capsulatus_cf.AAC.11